MLSHAGDLSKSLLLVNDYTRLNGVETFDLSYQQQQKTHVAAARDSVASQIRRNVHGWIKTIAGQRVITH